MWIFFLGTWIPSFLLTPFRDVSSILQITFSYTLATPLPILICTGTKERSLTWHSPSVPLAPNSSLIFGFGCRYFRRVRLCVRARMCVWVYMNILVCVCVCPPVHLSWCVYMLECVEARVRCHFSEAIHLETRLLAGLEFTKLVSMLQGSAFCYFPSTGVTNATIMPSFYPFVIIFY